MDHQNEFIQEQQHQAQYFIDIFPKKISKEIASSVQSNSLNIINRTIQQLQTGLIQMPKLKINITDKLLKHELPSQDEKRRIQNKKRLEYKKRINTLLQIKSQSNTLLANQITPHILSYQQHKKLIHSLVKQKKHFQQKINKKKQQQNQQKSRSKSQIQKMQQLKKIQELQLKKQKIKQKLKKMRQNHEFVLNKQKQSRKIYKQIRQRKKLHQKLKQLYEQNIVLPIIQQNNYKLKNIKDNSKLNFQEIIIHEKQYLQLKKQAKNSKKSTGDYSKQHNYSPLPHSERINKILEQENKNNNLFQINKNKIKQKLLKISNYTAIVRQKYRPSMNKNKTMAAERQQSSLERDQQKKDVNRIQLGNQYLKIARKRAKTQPRHGTQSIQVQVQIPQGKSKSIGRPHLDSQKRQEILYKMKKQQILKILDCKHQNPEQKLKRMKQADLKLNYEIQKTQKKLKLKQPNKNHNEQILNLLLTTIKAKINLLQIEQNE